MKKKLIIITLLLFSVSAFSQIEEEIKNYVDSTKLFIENGRKMMLENLNDSNYQKVNEIYDYLKNITEHKTMYAFYFNEALYINMITNNWNEVDHLMKSYGDNNDQPIINYYGNALIRKLYDIIEDNYKSLLINSQHSQLTSEAKSVVELYLTYTIRMKEEYYDKLNDYKKNFKSSNYEDFINNLLPKEPYRNSITLSIGSGVIFTTNDLSDYFKSNASFNLSLDFHFERIFASFYMNATNYFLKKPFIAQTNFNSILYKKDEKFNYFNGGFKAGYAVIYKNKFKLTPYISISGSSLESTRYNKIEDKDLEYQFFDSFSYGGGVEAEVKLFTFNNHIYYYGSGLGAGSYLSFKIQGGYNMITKFDNEYAKGDTPYVIGALVYGFGLF